MRILGLFSVCLAIALPPIVAEAKESALVGDWETVQTCGSWSRAVVLKVREGGKGRLKGTAQIDKRSGKIVAGWVDGRAFEFETSFAAPLQRKRAPTDTWTGKVSRDGRTISGEYRSGDPQISGDCSFRGKRR